MKTFHYYKGNHLDGFVLLTVITKEKLSIADSLFEEKFGYSPLIIGVVVTLSLKNDAGTFQ